MQKKQPHWNAKYHSMSPAQTPNVVPEDHASNSGNKSGREHPRKADLPSQTEYPLHSTPPNTSKHSETDEKYSEDLFNVALDTHTQESSDAPSSPSPPRPAELPMRQHHPRIKKPHTKGLPQVRPAPTHLTQSIQTSRTLEPPRLGYRDSSPSRLPSQIRSLLKIRQHTKPTYRPSL